MTRHTRGCDCDVCHRDLEIARLRRQGWRGCLSCGSMMPRGYGLDECEPCRIESGAARYCDCGNAVIEASEDLCGVCSWGEAFGGGAA